MRSNPSTARRHSAVPPKSVTASSQCFVNNQYMLYIVIVTIFNWHQITSTIKNIHILYRQCKYSLLTGFELTETLSLYIIPCTLYCFIYDGIFREIFYIIWLILIINMEFFPRLPFRLILEKINYLSRHFSPSFPDTETNKFMHS